MSGTSGSAPRAATSQQTAPSLGELVFPGTGQMQELCRRLDWAATPLGPVQSWPSSLRTAVAIVLRSSFPTVLVWGPDRIQIYNEAYAPLIGTRHPEMLGAPLRATWPNIDEEQEARFARVFRGEMIHLTEARYLLDRTGSGVPEELYFDASLTPVPLEDGGVGGSLSTLIEVTPRVRARHADAERDRLLAELADERARLIDAQTVAKVGSWQTDFATMDVVWSDETFRIFGLDSSSFTPSHQAFLDRIHPEDRDRVHAAFQASIGSRDVHSVEHRILLADGTIKHLEERWRTFDDSAGSPPRAVGTCQDVTARWVADSERSELATALQHLTEEAVSIIDSAGHFVYANDTHARLLGYDPARLGTLTVYAFIPDDAAREEFDHMLEEARHGRSWNGVVHRRRLDDGQILPFDLVLGAISGGSDGVRFFAIMRDASERLARERHLRRVERVAGMGTLIAGVAHELNNPLSAILGFTQLLLLDPRSEEERDDLTTIAREAQRMAKIVSDLRWVAQGTQESTQLRRVQLNDIVQHILKTRAYSLRTRNIELRADLADDLPDIWADRSEIEQVVLNLVVNAEQAMANMDAGDARLIVRTRATAKGCVLSVFDSGPGIPRDHLERIFDPFFTTKAPGEGTGLGLSLVQSIVTEHRGEIHVESEVGKGSAFRVDLPRAPDLPNVSAQTAPPAAPAHLLRVLVVDDEEAVRRVVARVLERRGHTVHQAAEGAQALALLQAATPAYDVVVSDLRMPGLGGFALLERLRKQGSDLARRVVFLTGDTASPDVMRTLSGLRVPMLAKPVGVTDVVRLVEQIGAAESGEGE